MTELWLKLQTVNCFNCFCNYLAHDYRIKGTVTTIISANIIDYKEHGCWLQTNGKYIQTTNQYRWLLTKQASLQLWQQRFGEKHGVLLAEFTDSGEQTYHSPAHFCGSDCYQAQLTLSDNNIELLWTIKGNNKNGIQRTCYS